MAQRIELLLTCISVWDNVTAGVERFRTVLNIYCFKFYNGFESVEIGFSVIALSFQNKQSFQRIKGILKKLGSKLFYYLSSHNRNTELVRTKKNKLFFPVQLFLHLAPRKDQEELLFYGFQD